MFLRHQDSVRPHLQERHPWQSFSVFEQLHHAQKSTAGSGIGIRSRRSMDIQKLVDERIEELLARKNMSSPTPEIRHEVSRDDLSDLGDVIDEAMMDVAERVLAISDRVAGDFARMEKDILDSRLAVLQSAEAVLDIAVSLRRRAKALTADSMDSERRKPHRDEDLHLVEAVRDLEDSNVQDGRASMHDHGVASLFRRT